MPLSVVSASTPAFLCGDAATYSWPSVINDLNGTATEEVTLVGNRDANSDREF